MGISIDNEIGRWENSVVEILISACVNHIKWHLYLGIPMKLLAIVSNMAENMVRDIVRMMMMNKMVFMINEC